MVVIWLLEALFGADAIGGPWSAGLRAALSLVLAFAVSIGFGRIFIAYQRRKQRLENTVRGDSKRLDALHLHKSSTPTMGGVIIFVASSLPSLLLVGSFGAPVLLLVGIGGALGAIGFADDWIKLRAPKKKGLSPRRKLLAQFCIGAVAGAAVLLLPVEVYESGRQSVIGEALVFPWSASWVLPLGFLFVPWVALVVTATSNAVNLTDGLDGLATGCSILVAATLTVLALVLGDSSASGALGFSYIPAAGEVAVWGASMCGACLGFLWFNCHPAEIFMGDTGSLPLGGTLGLMGVLLRHELLLLVLGGVLVAEALSVILQIISFRVFGRRIFRIAPLHHHFQFLGWTETRVTTRFWIAAAACAAISAGSLAAVGWSGG